MFIKFKTICAQILIFLILSSIAFGPNLAHAQGTTATKPKVNLATDFKGNVIGPPSGTATMTGTYPVTNLKVQTIYTGTNPTGTNDICVARLTWGKQVKVDPNPSWRPTFDKYGIEAKGASNVNFVVNYVDLNTLTYDENNLICGKNYTFEVGTYYSATGTLATYGKSSVSFTLANPITSNPTAYNVSMGKITTTKTGSNCTATVSWTRPAGNLNNTRIKYRLLVAANDGSANKYTSPDLANTVSSQTTGNLACGKDYTADIVLLLDGAKAHSDNAGFAMPAATANDGTQPAPSAGTKPINEGNIIGTTTTIANPDGSGGGDGECVTKLCVPGPGWQIWKVNAGIQRSICEMQCTSIGWLTTTAAFMIDKILIPSLGLDNSTAGY